MNWTGWSDFAAMGGYAFYVWGSYLVTFGVLCAEVALLRLRRRSALAYVARYHSGSQGQPDETAS